MQDFLLTDDFRLAEVYILGIEVGMGIENRYMKKYLYWQQQLIN